MANDRGARSSRREALGRVAFAASGALAVAAVVPAARMVATPALDAKRSAQVWIRVARLDELFDGVPKRVRVVGDVADAWTVSSEEALGAVWLLRDGDEVRALAAACPHLGCSIDRAADGAGFDCPCHGSSFDRDGTRRSGPSPRDMDRLPARVVGSGGERVVEVRLVRFRTGLARREALG